jgi:hypothetical protein
MSDESSSPTRRSVLAATAASGALGLVTSASTGLFGSAQAEGAAGGDAIQPFRVDFPEAKLADLRRRIKATNWPERETVKDDSQASNSRRLRSSRAIGRRTTTGASARRS